MSYNNRGNYGNNRNYGGNGNRNNGNNRSQGYDDNKYLNPSSTKKVIHYNGDTDPTTGKDKTLRVSFSENETEEISFSLTPEKVQDFINRLQAASDAEGGTGGAYLSFYCKRSRNKRTGEEFDGINILVNKQNPPDERYQRGSFRGNAGGGRRTYPANGGGNTYSGRETGNRNSEDYTTRGTGTTTSSTTEARAGYQGDNTVRNNANQYSEPEF